MRQIVPALALLATTAVGAGAQQLDQPTHNMPAVAAPCPLHLETLGLSAAQKIVIDSLHSAHLAVMKTMMTKHAGGTKMNDDDKEAMERSMRLAIAGVLVILDQTQAEIFTAAVTAHEEAMKDQGDEGCMECCKSCLEHSEHVAPPKKPDV
jgi:hypothetical protein